MAPKVKDEGLDALDMELIHLLAKDGRMSVIAIAERLKSTAPTIRSRIERLTQSGVMRVTALVDAFKVRNLTIALVGMRVDKHQELEKKSKQIADLKEVHWVTMVSGQYDIIAEVILLDGMHGLYRFISEELPRVGGIRSTESFMVIKPVQKWVRLPLSAGASPDAIDR